MGFVNKNWDFLHILFSKNITFSFKKLSDEGFVLNIVEIHE